MKSSIQYRIAELTKKTGLVKTNPADCPELVAMKTAMASLSGGGIQFSVSRNANGEWVAESVNVPGIITGGDAKDDADAMIKDAIFTYYAVPPLYCDDILIREANEPITIKQQVFATA